VASRARSGSLVLPCRVGSQKRSSACSFTDSFARPGPRGSHVHTEGAGRTVVVCAQKSPRLLDVDGSLPKEPTSGRLRGWGSEPARRVSGCGRPLQRDIVLVTAKRISGRRPGR